MVLHRVRDRCVGVAHDAAKAVVHLVLFPEEVLQVLHPFKVARDDASSIRSAVTEVANHTDHLDLLVNNAGIYPDPGPGILETSPELLTKALKTNTLGPPLVSQAFRPLLKKSRSGRIINLSSGLSQLTDMEDMGPAYSISKTALNAVTRQLAAALAPDAIAVNAVCPGWVRTDMGGPNADRSPAEGVDTIVWLATLPADGPSGGFFRDRQPIPW